MIEDSSRQKIYGVILAAGAGARIRPLSFDIPKPLLPVCNKSVIAYQIEYMKNIGIDQIRIVVGHLGRHIMDAFGNGDAFGVEIRYVIQEKALGIAHAVYQLEDEVDGPFLLFLGDIFFVPKNLDQMIDSFRKRNATAILAVKNEPRKDMVRRNFAVTLGDDTRVVKVIEKPRYVKDNLKGCGIYLFDLPIFDAIRRTPRTAMRDEYEITTAIQILIDDGYPVYSEETIAWDMNVTIPEDLLYCNLKMLLFQSKNSVIADDAVIAGGTKIHNSVIGPGVTIKNPIEIKNCLIMAGAQVNSLNNLEWQIIASGNAIQCPEPDQFCFGDLA